MPVPTTRPIQNSFNGGEISPLLYGRADLEKYGNSCKEITNWIPMLHGGAQVRWGTRYVTASKSGSVVILVPFEFSEEQNYVLEFGHNYIRVIKDGVEVWTGASEGANLITNGTFAANITSWTNKSTGNGTAVWSAYSGGSLRLYVTIRPGVGAAEQAITTEVGATYKLKFDSIYAGVDVRVGSISGGTDIVAPTSFLPGTNRELDFVAIGTTTYIGFYGPSTVLSQYVDNVMCKKQVTPVPVEITTTYTDVQLPYLKFAQSADILFIWHPDHAEAQLSRLSHTSWVLADSVFSPPPTYEADTDLAQTLTPAATTGNNVSFVAGGNCFLAADVDREIIYGTSRAVIITRDSATEVHADIRVAFPDTNPIASGSWFLNGSPATSCTPSKKRKGAKCTLTLADNGWRTEDIGKYVRIQGGICKISGFTTAAVVTAEILVALDAASATVDWTLEVAEWSAVRGYPRCGCFFEGRLWRAGTDARPQTLWGSRVEDYFRIGRGTADNAAVNYTLDASKVNVLQWLMPSAKGLLAMTNGEEFPMKTTEGTITPSNPPSLKSDSNIGASYVPPVKLNQFAIFLQAMGRQLIQYGYGWEEDSYVGEDLSMLAEHLTAGGITRIAFQKQPQPIIWCVTAGGNLLSITYRPKEKVIAWAEHTTDGSFEDICVLPNLSQHRDDIYVSVARAIGAVTYRYIEVADPAIAMDSALEYTGTAATVISGLDHLEGETLKVIADGAQVGDEVVASGDITLGAAAASVVAGLPIPAPTIVTLPPEVEMGGTIQALRKRWVDLWVRLISSQGVEVNGEPTSATALKTGDAQIHNLGWDRDGCNTIIQTQPLPATVLCIFGTLEVGG
jgi:hypothetical protein